MLRIVENERVKELRRKKESTKNVLIQEEGRSVSRQINSKVDSDDVQELLYFYNQELTIDELIEMHESTTPAEDRYIVLSAKRNRRTTAQQVANQFLAASGKQISRKTVARRLRGEGLYARRPVVCVPLTRQHRTARLQWCEHHNWTEQDWACVLYSDESRFSLSSDCRRQLIWRESGTAYRPENIQEKDRYLTCSIMVWAGIMINGRTRLLVVANGTMTGQ
ncbi:transposable element Tcb1 transposase [Trichonephila clavipes]|nr:transposable element Tcb1 transposase [Trichonephila clavipes]